MQACKSLDAIFAEEEARLATKAAEDTPEARARHAAKVRKEFERGVRLGWHDADGEPLADDDEADEEEDE